MKKIFAAAISGILAFILCFSGSSADAFAADSVQTDEEFEESIADFPESYKELLREIHSVYPNYTFTAEYIDEDFDEIVESELGRKKVSQYSAYSWRAIYDESYGSRANYDFDTGTWIYTEGGYTYASKEVIAYYMDPRNFLDTSNIYMFMELSYSEDQTLEDLESFLEGTFLAEDYEPNEDDEDDVRLGGSYAAVIMEAAELSGMSPYVIATSILTEQGTSGNSSLISGYYEADDGTIYEGYYNFFNIGATGDTTNDVIQNGLKKAKENGWTSVYSSIVNGAIWTADSYVTQGQDTYYYREFNVTDTDRLWHQYSTAITTAYNAASILCEALSSYTNAAINFKIPVYNNMSDEAAEEPEYNSNLNNYYFLDMQASGLSPEYTMANHSYTLTVSGNTTLYLSVPDGASYVGKSSYSLAKGENTVSLVVKSQTGYERTYKVTVTAQTACKLTVNTTFVDGTVTDNIYNAIMWAAVNGISKGYSDGTFGVGNTVTREEMVIFLYRLAGYLGYDTSASADISFTDAADIRTKTGRVAVSWAIAEGITEGYSDGTFRPQDECSREEICIFLWRLAGEPEVDDVSSILSNFSDAEEITNSTAEKAIAWAYSEGIVKGFTSGENKGKFCPTDSCLREQFAIMMYRYAN